MPPPLPGSPAALPSRRPPSDASRGDFGFAAFVHQTSDASSVDGLQAGLQTAGPEPVVDPATESSVHFVEYDFHRPLFPIFVASASMSAVCVGIFASIACSILFSSCLMLADASVAALLVDMVVG